MADVAISTTSPLPTQAIAGASQESHLELHASHGKSLNDSLTNLKVFYQYIHMYPWTCLNVEKPCAANQPAVSLTQLSLLHFISLVQQLQVGPWALSPYDTGYTFVWLLLGQRSPLLGYVHSALLLWLLCAHTGCSYCSRRHLCAQLRLQIFLAARPPAHPASLRPNCSCALFV